MSTERPVISVLIGYSLVLVVTVAWLALFEPVAVTGGSMYPALHPSDVALVRRSERGESGDIVLLRRPGRSAVLHRVERVESDGRLVTRGDANPIADLTIASQADIDGVVAATIPVGRVMQWWRAPGNRDTLSAQSDTARR